MKNIGFKKIVKIQSIILIAAFLAQDIAWSYPDPISASKSGQNTKLAPESFFKQKLSKNTTAAALIENLIERHPKFSGNISLITISQILNSPQFKTFLGLNSITCEGKDGPDNTVAEVLIKGPGYIIRYYDPAAEKKYVRPDSLKSQHRQIAPRLYKEVRLAEDDPLVNLILMAENAKFMGLTKERILTALNNVPTKNLNSTKYYALPKLIEALKDLFCYSEILIIEKERGGEGDRLWNLMLPSKNKNVFFADMSAFRGQKNIYELSDDEIMTGWASVEPIHPEISLAENNPAKSTEDTRQYFIGNTEKGGSDETKSLNIQQKGIEGTAIEAQKSLIAEIEAQKEKIAKDMSQRFKEMLKSIWDNAKIGAFGILPYAYYNGKEDPLIAQTIMGSIDRFDSALMWLPLAAAAILALILLWHIAQNILELIRYLCGARDYKNTLKEATRLFEEKPLAYYADNTRPALDLPKLLREHPEGIVIDQPVHRGRRLYEAIMGSSLKDIDKNLDILLSSYVASGDLSSSIKLVARFPNMKRVEQLTRLIDYLLSKEDEEDTPYIVDSIPYNIMDLRLEPFEISRFIGLLEIYINRVSAYSGNIRAGSRARWILDEIRNNQGLISKFAQDRLKMAKAQFEDSLSLIDTGPLLAQSLLNKELRFILESCYYLPFAAEEIAENILDNAGDEKIFIPILLHLDSFARLKDPKISKWANELRRKFAIRLGEGFPSRKQEEDNLDLCKKVRYFINPDALLFAEEHIFDIRKRVNSGTMTYDDINNLYVMKIYGQLSEENAYVYDDAIRAGCQSQDKDTRRISKKLYDKEKKGFTQEKDLPKESAEKPEDAETEEDNIKKSKDQNIIGTEIIRAAEKLASIIPGAAQDGAFVDSLVKSHIADNILDKYRIRNDIPVTIEFSADAFFDRIPLDLRPRKKPILLRFTYYADPDNPDFSGQSLTIVYGDKVCPQMNASLGPVDVFPMPQERDPLLDTMQMCCSIHDECQGISLWDGAYTRVLVSNNRYTDAFLMKMASSHVLLKRLGINTIFAPGIKLTPELMESMDRQAKKTAKNAGIDLILPPVVGINPEFGESKFMGIGPIELYKMMVEHKEFFDRIFKGLNPEDIRSGIIGYNNLFASALTRVKFEDKAASRDKKKMGFEKLIVDEDTIGMDITGVLGRYDPDHPDLMAELFAPQPLPRSLLILLNTYIKSGKVPLWRLSHEYEILEKHRLKNKISLIPIQKPEQSLVLRNSHILFLTGWPNSFDKTYAEAVDPKITRLVIESTENAASSEAVDIMRKKGVIFLKASTANIGRVYSWRQEALYMLQKGKYKYNTYEHVSGGITGRTMANLWLSWKKYENMEDFASNDLNNIANQENDWFEEKFNEIVRLVNELTRPLSLAENAEQIKNIYDKNIEGLSLVGKVSDSVRKKVFIWNSLNKYMLKFYMPYKAAVRLIAFELVYKESNSGKFIKELKDILKKEALKRGSTDRYERIVAVYLLGQTNHEGKDLEETVEILAWSLFNDIDFRVRAEAAKALGHLNDINAIGHLKDKLLQLTDHNIFVRRWLSWALSRYYIDWNKDVEDKEKELLIKKAKVAAVFIKLAANRILPIFGLGRLIKAVNYQSEFADYADCLLKLANIYHETGYKRKALHYYKSAIKNYRRSMAWGGMLPAPLEVMIAEIYFEMDELDHARESLFRVISLLKVDQLVTYKRRKGLYATKDQVFALIGTPRADAIKKMFRIFGLRTEAANTMGSAFNDYLLEEEEKFDQNKSGIFSYSVSSTEERRKAADKILEDFKSSDHYKILVTNEVYRNFEPYILLLLLSAAGIHFENPRLDNIVMATIRDLKPPALRMFFLGRKEGEYIDYLFKKVGFHIAKKTKAMGAMGIWEDIGIRKKRVIKGAWWREEGIFSLLLPIIIPNLVKIFFGIDAVTFDSLQHQLFWAGTIIYAAFHTRLYKWHYDAESGRYKIKTNQYSGLKDRIYFLFLGLVFRIGFMTDAHPATSLAFALLTHWAYNHPRLFESWDRRLATISPGASVTNKKWFEAGISANMPFIVCKRGTKDEFRIGFTKQGFESLMNGGLMRRTVNLRVGPLREWVEIDGVKFSTKSDGLAELEKVLNEKYVPPASSGKGKEIRISLASMGYKITFPARIRGVNSIFEGRLDDEALFLLQDPNNCGLLHPDIIIRLSKPNLHFKRRTPSGGEKELEKTEIMLTGSDGKPVIVDISKSINCMHLNPDQLTAIFNHPLINSHSTSSDESAQPKTAPAQPQALPAQVAQTQAQPAQAPATQGAQAQVQIVQTPAAASQPQPAPAKSPTLVTASAPAQNVLPNGHMNNKFDEKTALASPEKACLSLFDMLCKIYAVHGISPQKMVFKNRNDMEVDALDFYKTGDIESPKFTGFYKTHKNRIGFRSSGSEVVFNDMCWVKPHDKQSLDYEKPVLIGLCQDKDFNFIFVVPKGFFTQLNLAIGKEKNDYLAALKNDYIIFMTIDEVLTNKEQLNVLWAAKAQNETAGLDKEHAIVSGENKSPSYGNTEGLASYVGDLLKANSDRRYYDALMIIMAALAEVQNEDDMELSTVNFAPFKNNLKDFFETVYPNRTGPGYEEFKALLEAQDILDLRQKSGPALLGLKKLHPDIIGFIGFRIYPLRNIHGDEVTVYVKVVKEGRGSFTVSFYVDDTKRDGHILTFSLSDSFSADKVLCTIKYLFRKGRIKIRLDTEYLNKISMESLDHIEEIVKKVFANAACAATEEKDATLKDKTAQSQIIIEELNGKIEEFLTSIHSLAAPFISAADIPEGAQILLSETLFDEIDAQYLKKILRDNRFIKIMGPKEIRNASLNRNRNRQNLACVIKTADYDNPELWNDNNKANNKAALLILNEDLEGSRYLYLEGIIGLARTMMNGEESKDSIERYIKLMFDKSEDISNAQLLEFLLKDPRKFADYIKFKTRPFDKEELYKNYKAVVDNYLIAA